MHFFNFEKMNKTITALLLISLAIVPTVQAQISYSTSIVADGITRSYRVYVPAIYDGSTPVPLVFNLHGYTSNAVEQEMYGDFRPIADTANFIIVCPNGTDDATGVRFWNCLGADNVGVDDVHFISLLIDTLSAEYNIDATRIYSTGMSNGGFMSYTLAGELGDRIAAVASVCGSITYDRFPAIMPTHPTPVMEIHGTADFTIPYDGFLIFMPVEAVLDYWIEFNNCDSVPEIIEVPDISPGDGCTATHYIYSGGANNTRVELFKINGGGHTWPGSPIIIGVTNQDINASLEIWRFFLRYSLDALTAIPESSFETADLRITPNPVKSECTIAADNARLGEVRLFDMQGACVFADYSNATDVKTIDLQNLAPGMYTLMCKVNGRYQFEKIIRQ